MDKLRNQLKDLIKSSTDNITLEENITATLAEFCLDTLSQVLEEVDDELMPDMQAKGYHVKDKKNRTISCLFGTLNFKRRMWQLDNESVFPLDLKLGYPSYLRFSPLMMMKITKLATHNTYNKTAEAVTLLTQTSISSKAVRNIAMKSAELVEEYNRLIEYNQVPVTAKEVNVLYLEGDGLMIKNQDGTSMTLHRFQVHEGTEKVTRKRTKTVNLVSLSDVSYQTALGRMTTYFQRYYDLTNTIVLSNSDMGVGYKAQPFQEIADGCMAHEHFIDRYHVSRKLKERLWFCEDLIPKMKQAIYDWDKSLRKTVLQTAESFAVLLEDPTGALEDIRLLRNYLARNWEYLKPLRLREVFQSHSGIGCCESNHRPYSYRMKHQGRSWSKAGANAMAHLIDAVRNGTLKESLTNAWQRVAPCPPPVEKQRKHFAATGNYVADHVAVQQTTIPYMGSSDTPLGRLIKEMRWGNLW
jgi:hypothetical protein